MEFKALADILNDAAEEIKTLRRQNELLRARVEMIDLFAQVLYTKPAEHPSSPYGVDILQNLYFHRNKITEKLMEPEK